ncbi:MAG: DUF5688 family protein [Lachnospiraceae bacterium]|nr:DUF5688 family protein [Lachnospiraceae bacterium]
MDYNEFVLKAQEDLATFLPGKVITRESIDKPQGVSYEGLVARPKDSNVGVILNMDILYEDMNKDGDYDQMLSDMINFVKESSQNVSQEEIIALFDYSQMKDTLMVELIGREQNSEILENIPHYDMEDLSLIYRFNVSDLLVEEGIYGTVLVKNEHLKIYGITQEQLHHDAMENAVSREPYVIRSISSVLAEAGGIPMAEPEESPSVVVATNTSQIYGAAVITYPDFMENAAEQFRGDFYILPSSIHDVVLLKDDGQKDYRVLDAMVSEVNEEAVIPQERLSNRAYHYDSKQKIFELAETFENRTRGREEKRHSVLDDLKSFGEKAEQQRPEKVRPAPARGMAL